LSGENLKRKSASPPAEQVAVGGKRDEIRRPIVYRTRIITPNITYL